MISEMPSKKNLNRDGHERKNMEKGSRSKKKKKCEFSLNAFKAYWLQTLIKAHKNYEKLTVFFAFILDLFSLSWSLFLTHG